MDKIKSWKNETSLDLHVRLANERMENLEEFLYNVTHNLKAIKIMTATFNEGQTTTAVEGARKHKNIALSNINDMEKAIKELGFDLKNITGIAENVESLFNDLKEAILKRDKIIAEMHAVTGVISNDRERLSVTHKLMQLGDIE